MFGLGPMVAFFVAALLVVGRDDIGTTNVALLIALVVVVAATADRAAGVATALVASLAYNFFHTEPYRSLRINDGQDILTVVLLIVIGLVVSEISARARTAISGRKRLGDAERSLERTAGTPRRRSRGVRVVGVDPRGHHPADARGRLPLRRRIGIRSDQ